MKTQPQFRTVVRGFDPEQVTATLQNMYTALTIARRTAAERTLELASAQNEVQRLAEELEAARSQAADHTSTSTHGYDDLGERIGAMLRLAEEESSQVRQTSQEEARLVRESAEADTLRMTSAAQEAADSIVQQATHEAAARRQEADDLYDERRALLEHAQEDIHRQLAEGRAHAEAVLAEERARHEERIAELRADADALAQQGDEIRQSARTEATSLLEQARTETDQVRQDAEAGLAELKADHQRIRGHLDHLHRVLGELLDQTPELGIRHSHRNGADDSAAHPSPTDLPSHGRWFLERVSHRRDDPTGADGRWEDVFDRRD